MMLSSKLLWLVSFVLTASLTDAECVLTKRTLTPSQLEKYSCTATPRSQDYEVSPLKYHERYQEKEAFGASQEKLDKTYRKKMMLLNRDGTSIQDQADKHSNTKDLIYQEVNKARRKIAKSKEKADAYLALWQQLGGSRQITVPQALAQYAKDLQGSSSSSSEHLNMPIEQYADTKERIQQYRNALLANHPPEYFDVVASRLKANELSWKNEEDFTVKDWRTLEKAELKEKAIMREDRQSARDLKRIYLAAIKRHDQEYMNLADWYHYMRKKEVVRQQYANDLAA